MSGSLPLRVTDSGRVVGAKTRSAAWMACSRALRRSYGPSDSCRGGSSARTSMNTVLHPTGRPPSFTHITVMTILSSTTWWSRAVAFARYPSARRVHRLPGAALRLGPQARRTHPAESRSSSYGLVMHLRLLPASPRGDAVTLGVRPESVCLGRTPTFLVMCAQRRTVPKRGSRVGVERGCSAGRMGSGRA